LIGTAYAGQRLPAQPVLTGDGAEAWGTTWKRGANAIDHLEPDPDQLGGENLGKRIR
jgi:hypothetical protein